MPNDEIPPHWVLVECEFKKELANSAFHECIARGGVAWLAAVVRDKLNFRVPTDDTNLRRWEVCDWWLAFLGDVREKLSVAGDVAEQTIERVKRWLVDQVMPSLAAVAQLDDGTVWIRDKMWSAESRISPRLIVCLKRAGVTL